MNIAFTFMPENASNRMYAQYREFAATRAENSPIWNRTLTWLLFLPLLCLIARQVPYFAGPARSFQRQMALGVSDGPGYYRASLYGMLIMQASFAVAVKRNIGKCLKQNPLIVAALVLALVSILWSGSRVSTFNMCVEVSLCTLFACFLSVRFPAEQLMSLLMLMGVVSSMLSIAFALLLPSYGIFAGYSGGAWQGICDHKNTLGISMAYLLTPGLFAGHHSRAARVLYALLICTMIGLSQSRGAWIYTLGILCFVGSLPLIRRLRRYECALALLILCLLAVALCILSLSSFSSFAVALGKDPTMSGRTDIYREVWIAVLKAPFLGYGYGAFWGVSSEATQIGYRLQWMNINYSESGVLELALQLGFVGVGLIVLMIGRSVFQAVRLLRSPFYTPRVGWFLTIIVLAALSNVDAGWLLSTGTLDWTMILIACIGLDAEWRRSREARFAHASFVRETSLHASSFSGEQVGAAAPLAGASLQL